VVLGATVEKRYREIRSLHIYVGTPDVQGLTRTRQLLKE
jgi:hypothetical protein